MKYPTKMTIAGIDVPVKVIDRPVYTLYKCPSCKDPDTGDALILYLEDMAPVVCPCCKSEALQPMDTYAYGRYSIIDNNIVITATTEQIGGMNLVHEAIEGINDLCDLQMDHTQISTMGAMLYRAFASGNVDFTPQEKGVDYAQAA